MGFIDQLKIHARKMDLNFFEHGRVDNAIGRCHKKRNAILSSLWLLRNPRIEEAALVCASRK